MRKAVCRNEQYWNHCNNDMLCSSMFWIKFYVKGGEGDG